MTINILGTDYTIEKAHESDKCLDGCGGTCDPHAKRIVVATEFDPAPHSTCDLEECTKLNTRHELVHAFLNESGLMCNTHCDWARNEEMVDWVACQLPKMVKAMREAKAI